MIIKDTHGGTLTLTKTKLTERSGGKGRYYLNLADLRDGEQVLISQIGGKNYEPILYTSLWVNTGLYFEGEQKIGCRSFSKRVYAQIMKAAEAARKTEERKNG